MKITKQKLKQIITEELENVLNEQSSEDAFFDFYTTVRKMSPTRARVLAKTRSGGLTPAMKAQLQKAKEDKGLESVRQTADKLRKRENRFGPTNPATQSTAKALQKQLDALPDAGDSTSGEVGKLKQLASSVLNPVAGGQSGADMTSAQPQMSMAQFGDEVPGSRTASGPGGGGGAATTTKTKKVRKGRHDVKFQRMINRMEKAGDLSKSDWRKISRINVKLKDPAGAKELFNQITGKIQKKMKRDAAKLGLAGDIKDIGKNIRTDGSLDKKAMARSQQNAIELAQASDRPRLAKAIQRLQRLLKDAKKELKIQADAEREFGGGTVSPAATKAQLRVNYLEGRLSKIVQSTFERLKDAK